MKNSDFRPLGFRSVCNGGEHEIEINSTGEAARIRMFGGKVTRWLRIQSTATGRTYVVLNRRREYLDGYLIF